MKKLHRFLSLLLALALLCTVLPVRTQAAATPVSGTVYTSNLTDNAELTLTGNTILVVDTDRTLKSISGSYALKIQGDGSNTNTLAIDSKGHGISASSVSISSCILAIDCKKNGLNIDGDVNMNSGLLYIDTEEDAVCSKSGMIFVNGGIVETEGYCGFRSKSGNIFLSGRIYCVSGNCPAIYAENGVVSITGTVKADSKATGIYGYRGVDINGGSVLSFGPICGISSEAGSISVSGNVTTETKSQSRGGIWAKNSITIHHGVISIRDRQSGSCLYADEGNIVVEGGDVTVSGAYGINAKRGNIVLDGKVNALSGAHPAVYAQAGSVTLQGDISASSKITGIWAKKDLIIKEGKMSAYGDGRALISDTGSIRIQSPMAIQIPENGRVSGSTVVNDGGKEAKQVVIESRALSGTVSLDTPEPHPGSWVRYKLGGEAFRLYRDGVKLTARWMESPDGETDWKEVEGDTDSSGVPVYKCGVDDIGRYLRVSITAEGYEGYLNSTPRLVTKSACYVDVTEPKLIVSSNKVFVNNARISQQYLVFNYKKNIDSLTESDWASAVTPETDGLLDLGGTTGRTYYVYTRVRGSTTMEAGTDVACAAIYLGETVSVQDFTLTVTDKNGTALERENGNTYYCRINEPIRIVAEPVPSNATFSGIYFDKWINNSGSGAFYEDAACTRSLQSGQYYKQVYFKPTQARNGADVAAEFTRGYNDVIHTGFYLNVADSSGNWQAVSASSLRITARAGETVEDVPVTTYPSKAGLQGMTVQLRSGEGTAPVFTLRPETKTVDVDATKADLGVFYYDLYQNGTKIIGGFTVEVVTQPVEAVSLLPETLTGEPGMSYELAVQCYPSGSTGEAFWATSNSKVATVSKGVVTFTSDAEIGQTATITATVNGCKAACEVTVGGEVFDLMVDGIKVTSGNMDDILGNGVFSFDGFRTLTVSGSYTGSKDVISNIGIENLAIQVDKDSVLTCTSDTRNPIILRADTTITGPGRLTLSGGDTGVYMTAVDGTLTIRDASLDITANWGIGGTNGTNSTVLKIDHANITADSGYGAFCDFGGGITLKDCEIVQPADGKISGDGKDIVDEAGTRCNKVRIEATAWTNPFVDVAEGTFYYDAVLWAVNRVPQITNGIDETHFAPDKTCTRGQVVTFLWRAAGCPEPGGASNPFTDVKADAFYYKAVLWAVEQNITKGTSDTTFSPDKGCTRGQVVTFLHRFAGSPAPVSTEHPFKDVNAGTFYYEAVLWAVEQGVTNGTSDTTFSPDKTCTRGQIVTFLYRAINKT